ncbi:hypothetical protein CHU95_02720 [Niveispirillum lacus]|uniref:DUF2891 domain-containing protein n=1 Tax=Niveispirillum lacus TaxID=1981099 RepID=A0A255Z617_9PROT|nr:DUF2891 domain-containing protein [Niveispirillum lacus]OYQ36918.1 hypothetical protein CHU95_02720 [Niveispirillum lacus]
MSSTILSPALASHLAAAPLDHVTQEYPNKLDHVMGGAGDVQSPRDLHPIFFGSFDWHSCVHGWWTLLTLYRLFPNMPEALAIRDLADRMLTQAGVAGELAYLNRPESAGFERPYGWGWLLMLAAELHRHDSDEGRRWSATLHPLADAFAERFKRFLPKSPYPVRVGTHMNTGLALRFALEYADLVGDTDLATLCRSKALSWHSQDIGAQVWEPSQDEFLSPTLQVGELMRRVLPADQFARWFDAYLPDGLPTVLLQPPLVTDRSDGKIAHLDGLSLSRAWCLRSLATSLSQDDPRRIQALAAAERHVSAALPHIAEDYMGQHWLASFVLLAVAAHREDV